MRRWEALLRRGSSPLRRDGGPLRACARGYCGECQDLLDEGQKIDPEGENNAQVQDAREAIGSSHPEPRYVKPRMGPGERRPQRHPRGAWSVPFDRSAGWREGGAGLCRRMVVSARRTRVLVQRAIAGIGRMVWPDGRKGRAKAGKGRGSRTENGHGPAQSGADATEDRVIQMHGRAGATRRPGEWGEWTRGRERMVALARRTMGALRRDGTGIRVHGWGSRFEELAAAALHECSQRMWGGTP